MSTKIRLTETELTNLIKRVVQEQANNPMQKVDPQMVNYVISAWGGQNAVTVKQSSIGTTITNNKTKSVIIFDLKTGMVDYNKTGSIDIMPYSFGAGFDKFKKWFDSHNNYNPLSGFTSRSYIDEQGFMPGVKGMGSNTVTPSKKSIPFDAIQEYMSNEFNTKNNQKISVVLTFDGQNVVANLKGAEFVVTKN